MCSLQVYKNLYFNKNAFCYLGLFNLTFRFPICNPNLLFFQKIFGRINTLFLTHNVLCLIYILRSIIYILSSIHIHFGYSSLNFHYVDNPFILPLYYFFFNASTTPSLPCSFLYRHT